MRISVVQYDIKWEDKKSNFLYLEKLLPRLSGLTDLVILPEMFTTGFSMNVNRLGEPMDGETFNWLKTVSANGNFGICGSYIVSQNNNFFNRWVFVAPDYPVSFYDKRHLFSIGNEDKNFSQGRERKIFSYMGVRISPYICYDLRFPVWSRNKNEYDLAIYSANWPESRISVWNTLLKARAIENQCYVAGVNRTGTDGTEINYSGHSAIIDPKGELILSGETQAENIITTEISLSGLNEFRSRFPVSNDADDFLIKT